MKLEEQVVIDGKSGIAEVGIAFYLDDISKRDQQAMVAMFVDAANKLVKEVKFSGEVKEADVGDGEISNICFLSAAGHKSILAAGVIKS